MINTCRNCIYVSACGDVSKTNCAEKIARREKSFEELLNHELAKLKAKENK